MLSEQQIIEIMSKMSTILRATKSCKSIGEISKQTGLPTSTIQRYLNKKEYYELLVENGALKRENLDKAMEATKKWLQDSKQAGLKSGGLTTQKRHGYTKRLDGKFNGQSR